MRKHKHQTWKTAAIVAGILLAGYSLTDVAAAEGAKKGAAKHSPAQAIAEARCDQEARCGNVGSGKTYASRAECTAQIKSKLAKELNAYECPGGYDQKELNECLEEVRNENCMNPFDTLERVVSCRSSDICKAQH